MGRGAERHPRSACSATPLKAFLDTDVIVRHLTGDPPAMAKRAGALLGEAEELLLTDVVVAECVYVLESFYAAPAESVAEAMRALLAMPAVLSSDEDVLLRALELYERRGLDYTDAYLVACAELSGVGAIVSFDKDLARRAAVTVCAP